MSAPLRVLALIAACAGGALAGCGEDPGAPAQPLSGRYVLRSVEGGPLPYALSSDASGRHALLAESIDFDPSGRATRERTIRETRAAPSRDTTYTTRIEARYRVDGARIEVGWLGRCPPNANCVGDDVGTIAAGRLVLESALYHTRPGAPPRLVYSRP